MLKLIFNNERISEDFYMVAVEIEKNLVTLFKVQDMFLMLLIQLSNKRHRTPLIGILNSWLQTKFCEPLEKYSKLE